MPDWPSDEQLVQLFREWQAADYEADTLGDHDFGDNSPQQLAFQRASDRCMELVAAVAAVPADGPIGLGIKSYLQAEMLKRFDGGIAYLQASILQDVAEFVPELAPLIAAALAEEPAAQEAA
jgi:hypothetical protein